MTLGKKKLEKRDSAPRASESQRIAYRAGVREKKKGKCPRPRRLKVTESDGEGSEETRLAQ